jgi:hypothetical protein
VIPQWCSAPSSATETSSLEGGEEGGDDDDNIAYSTVVQGLAPGEARPSHSIFSHSLLSAGRPVSVSALHLPSLASLFVFLRAGDMASISKECFVSLLEHAEETLHCRTAYVFFEQSVSPELRRQIFHSFHLMGFQIVPPSDPIMSLLGSQYYFMSYELGDDDESDNED